MEVGVCKDCLWWLVVDIPSANSESFLTQITNSDGAESLLNVHITGPTGLCNFKDLKFNQGTEGETYVCNRPGVSGYISYIAINHHPQISAVRMPISIHRVHISRCNHEKRKPPLQFHSMIGNNLAGNQRYPLVYLHAAL